MGIAPLGAGNRGFATLLPRREAPRFPNWKTKAGRQNANLTATIQSERRLPTRSPRPHDSQVSFALRVASSLKSEPKAGGGSTAASLVTVGAG